MKKSTADTLLAICLVLIVVSLRLLPHPANFAPVAAAAIFGGALLPRRYALLVPLGAMMISDLIIGLHPLVPVTWSVFGLIALASNRWLKNGNIAKGALLTLSGSIFFFVVTNFAVWLTSGMYAHTWSGLARCYTLALPFFRNTLLGDAVYTAALFSIYALATALSVRALNAYRISRV
ncbi:MAG: DUF6580 family putative transport protein [Patescibacteria group bacterium]